MIDARRGSRLLALVVFAAQPITASLGDLVAWLGAAALCAVLFMCAWIEAARVRRERKAGR